LASKPKISEHADQRQIQRFPGKTNVADLGTRYGRKTHGSGCLVYIIGRREIKKYGEIAPEIRDLNGLHVYVSYDGTVITLLQNHDLQVKRDYKSRTASRRSSRRAA
jgi:hypothetical protein